MALRQFCQEGNVKWVSLLMWAGANPRWRGPALDDVEHIDKFGRVVNILRSRLDHPAFRTYLDRQKAIFAGQRQQAMKLFSNGSVINSTETLDLWLNGFEYHRDADKRTQYEALQSETLPVEV